jgi:hypothetical protein
MDYNVYELAAERTWQHGLAAADEVIERERETGEQLPIDTPAIIKDSLHGTMPPSFNGQLYREELIKTGAQEFLDNLPYLLEQLRRQEAQREIPIKNDYLLARAVDLAKKVLPE